MPLEEKIEGQHIFCYPQLYYSIEVVKVEVFMQGTIIKSVLDLQGLLSPHPATPAPNRGCGLRDTTHL